MVVSDESMAFPRWKGILKRRRNVSVYQFYDTLFRDSERAVIKGRRSRVLKGSVVNRTSEYGYLVPHQWQGSYDHHIEVRRFSKTQNDSFFTFRQYIKGCSLDTVADAKCPTVNAAYVSAA